MKAIIKPGKIKGRIAAPPSKSYAHRLLMGAALSDGTSTLEGISESEDMGATLDCIKALGAEFQQKESRVTVEGIFSDGGKARRSPDGKLPVFPCRESGSTLRFFIPIALAVCGGGVFTGSRRLIERGIGIYEELFRDSPVRVEKTENSICVSGTLTPGKFVMRGDVSSQFATGMLFALSLLSGDSEVKVLPPVESRAYIDITVDAMKTFGVSVAENEKNHFLIKGGQKFRSGDFPVEGDWSNAAFLYAFQTIGNEIEICGLKEDSMQGDKACTGFFERLSGKRTEKEETIDISNTPDLGPVLFAAAAALRGGVFTGTRRLRIKESDRAEAMAEELKKFGITCLVGENDVVIMHGPLGKPGVPLNGHNDHRIVMALSVLASLTGGEIEGAEAVRKSWPDFFERMKETGLPVELIH